MLRHIYMLQPHIDCLQLKGFPVLTPPRLLPSAVAVNDRQLRWAGLLSAALQAALQGATPPTAAAGGDAAAVLAAAAPVPASAFTTPSKPVQPSRPATPPSLAPASAAGMSPLTSPTHAASGGRPQAKALGVFGKVWDFLVDEAAYSEAGEGELCCCRCRICDAVCTANRRNLLWHQLLVACTDVHTDMLPQHPPILITLP